MNLLGIDTSSDNVSLGIIRKGRLAVDFNRRIKFGASKVMPVIEKYVKKTSLDLRKIDAFVVGAGPGSFTGLRISFSIVKAFSLSLDKPVIKVGSFFSMAYPYRKKHKKIAVIGDARRGLIYAASFKVNKDVLKIEGREELVDLESFVRRRKDYFFVSYEEHLKRKVLEAYPAIKFCNRQTWPRAGYLLELAKDYYVKGKFTALDKLVPLYLHPKTCQIRIKK
ncbi:MAG: tRNA (adenosine(37)-N6)-threonylcarbamoyltransferase complex dimerization subunit type 1 TsaB [Candidatus Omnitrophota bacterium]|nr:MAG: tRNA (adenosine(37)-N6)-threonylcarbamoyltransferase complex dimerization subunit type 1 TsaB [Candidatus Omnitrophota bacterium]